MSGGDGSDLMWGGGGNDTMYGDAGDDVMYGDYGDDLMHGGTGNDYIEGENGNDTIIGGEGNDVLSGGSGKDLFKYNETANSTGYGDDRIEAPNNGGRDFSLTNRDTIVFDVDAGFDPDADLAVVSGDWDGDGDALDVMIAGANGSVLIEDFWQSADPLTTLLAGGGFYDSVSALNSYSQGNATYDMITFV